MVLVPAQRVAAYGTAVRDGAVLLVRSGASGRFPGRWSLPGGGVDHGEHPLEALSREFGEATGLAVTALGAPRLHSDVLPVPRDSELIHHVRVCWTVEVAPGELRGEESGSTDRVEWVPLGRALTPPAIAPFVHAEILRAAGTGGEVP